MNDHETQLAEMLHERAAVACPDDRLGDVLAASTDVRVASARPSRWRWPAVAATLALVAGGVWALSRRSANDAITTPDATTTSPAAPDPNVAAWQPFTAPPLSARSGNLSISTGDGWFVWGGYASADADPYWHTLDDGAYFDGATGEWRTLPAVPHVDEVDGSHQAAVWTGREVVVVQSTSVPRVTAFDPVAFTWRTIEVPADIVAAWPSASGSYTPGSYHFVDGRVVLFVRADAGTAGGPTVLLLDPITGEWTVGATPPTTMRATMYWWVPTAASATELFVLDAPEDPRTCTGSTTLFIYDVQADTWRDQSLAREGWHPAVMAWTGDRLLLSGGRDCGGEWPAAAVRDSTLLDPVAGSWTAGANLPVDLGEADHPGAEPVLLGDQVVAMGADMRPLVYDPGTDQWWRGPSPLPDGSNAEARLVAVAGQLRMWSPGLHRRTSGGSQCCYPTGEAYTLTVPPPERWGVVEVATIPTLEPTTTMFTGETVALPTSTAVANSTP